MSKSPFDLVHQNDSIESKIVASLERISQAFRVLLWEESNKYSTSPIQIQVLIFLLHHSVEKGTISYLAEEFNMTKATISDTVKSLEEKALIKKQYKQADERSYIIHLTDKGKTLAGKSSFFAEQVQLPIRELSREDKENLFLSLITIIDHLNKTDVITIQRMCKTCAYYDAPKNGKSHFCRLLNKSLRDQELRVDCPEHLQLT